MNLATAPDSTFSIYAYRFTFEAVDELTFPAVAANTIRGALGTVLQGSEFKNTGFFRPRGRDGPSGFADRPRAFVLRAHALNERRIGSGEEFAFDVHFFENGVQQVVSFARAVRLFASTGLGIQRSRARLKAVHQIDAQRGAGGEIDPENETAFEPSARIALSAMPSLDCVTERIAIEFVTPLELKVQGAVIAEVPFGPLLARLSERISALSLFYGRGLKEFDWEMLRESASKVRTVKSDVTRRDGERRSSRTGQRHALGGVAGMAVYQGRLAIFLPWLEAGYWTGAGRQTVWGKGMIVTTRLDELAGKYLDERQSVRREADDL